MFMQKALNEDVIDYDILEDLVSHVDETYPAGAILVFLPVNSVIWNQCFLILNIVILLLLINLRTGGCRNLHAV